MNYRKFPAGSRPMRRKPWKLFAVLGITMLFLSTAPAAQAAKITERSKQKQLAETERAALRQKLDALKRDINRIEAAKDQATDALAYSEAAISDANRSLRELAEEQKHTAAKLNVLSKQQAELTTTVDAQHRKMAELLRKQYVNGNDDRIKLLLSGDNPSHISRDLLYLGYVSQAQAKSIEMLRTNLQAVEKNKADTQNAQDELDEIAQEERTQKALLEKEKAKRLTLLSQLSNTLATQRKQAGNIQRDEQRLGSLVDKLARLIEQQRKAEAAEAKRRQEQAARARAEREKQLAALAKNRSKRTLSEGRNKPNGIENDKNPSKLLARNELTPEADVQSDVFATSFSTLRGKLRLPVRGELVAKYGSKRGDGASWKGLFIRTEEGAEVKAVAAGMVVFAEWLRGFGNLIIVDHGSQYMTIYGNNQAILKRAGDAIKAGDVIASAGNTGGNEQSGLYFEMRHQGRAFDPLGWVTIR
jgi:septal ring factor EnvC (AmiA/AmiB activator)